MKMALAVLPNGRINPHFGRAKRLAIATVEGLEIVGWEEVESPFHHLHPGHPPGPHGGGHGHDHDRDHPHDHEPEPNHEPGHAGAHDHHHDHDHGRGHDHGAGHDWDAEPDHDPRHHARGHGHGGGRGGPEWAAFQAAIKDFLVQNGIDVLILDHAGPGLVRVLEETDIRIVTGARGSAREAVLHVARFLKERGA
ncbi:hypothetical protein TR75_02360 [Hydrogenibacillus schlegelii]|uniref:Dinitrogenase iron-molybdenum cofactor biosynthesis domain-containing protein n=1 Tax=Hydrogenibacillus schlegelii TaxID=1484 RepID=A0A132NC43_HYDSH|nr:hypothetical protein TR75_02360 [Hydrogenibacillus schlegelii]OAR04596.1 hypothetical protein SA87_08630 [Hydrogenibacillus schlegelii]